MGFRVSAKTAPYLNERKLVVRWGLGVTVVAGSVVRRGGAALAYGNSHQPGLGPDLSTAQVSIQTHTPLESRTPVQTQTPLDKAVCLLLRST